MTDPGTPIDLSQPLPALLREAATRLRVAFSEASMPRPAAGSGLLSDIHGFLVQAADAIDALEASLGNQEAAWRAKLHQRLADLLAANPVGPKVTNRSTPEDLADGRIVVGVQGLTDKSLAYPTMLRSLAEELRGVSDIEQHSLIREAADRIETLEYEVAARRSAAHARVCSICADKLGGR